MNKYSAISLTDIQSREKYLGGNEPEKRAAKALSMTGRKNAGHKYPMRMGMM